METTDFIRFKRLFYGISSGTAGGQFSAVKRLPVRILFVFLLGPTAAFCQENVWKVMTDVSYKTIRDKNGFEIDKPIFGEKLKLLNGKPVKIKGYLIPMNELDGSSVLMLSSMPFSTCYFCGGAGPETVIEVESKRKVEFSSQLLTFSGQLFLNDSDPDHHMYILKNATHDNDEN